MVGSMYRLGSLNLAKSNIDLTQPQTLIIRFGELHEIAEQPLVSFEPHPPLQKVNKKKHVDQPASSTVVISFVYFLFPTVCISVYLCVFICNVPLSVMYVRLYVWSVCIPSCSHVLSMALFLVAMSFGVVTSCGVMALCQHYHSEMLAGEGCI